MSTDGRTLVLGGPTGALGRLVDRDEDVESAADLERCLARLQADGDVAFVVVDPSWPRPLSAARRLRVSAPHVGLAVAVPPQAAASMRSRLAFLPDVDHVHVVTIDGDLDGLRRQLAATAEVVDRHQRVRGALDAINRDLAGAGPAREIDEAMPSVSTQYLAALVRHAADTIVSVDPHGCVVTINEAGQRTLGVTAAEVEGEPLRGLLAADDAGALERLLSAALSGRAQADDDLAVRLRSGHEVLLSATAAPILDDAGALVGRVLVARDVTAERQAARRLQALQKAESLATLASGVAHDFNNLLVQAQGWADFASEELDDRELVASALTRIGEATRRAAELARTMLAYGGRGSFEPRVLDLGELVADLRPLLSASVPAKIALDIDAGTAPQVRADPTQLRQIVLNLVTNAVEAIGDDQGGIRVRVTHEGERDEPQPWAVLEVADTGPGIDDDVRDRLFDPFFTTKFTGRGLGLAASQGIASAHGGSITVASRPGEGATLRLRLPAAGAER